MRRQTSWNWASLSGMLDDGRRIGANFASGVNETGFTENGFWLDSALTDIGPIDFQFNKRDRHQPWHIKDNAGKVDLIFTPEGERCEKLNAIILASNFTQLAGTFSGTILDRDNQIIQVSAIPGFCEDHYAKW